MPIADRLRRWSVFLPLTLVVSLGLAILLTILHYGTSAVDTLARANMYERVEVAMNIEARRLAELLEEYSFWDTAYEKLVAAPDAAWADENIGSYLFEEVGIEMAFVIGADGRPGFVFVDGKPAQSGTLSGIGNLDEAFDAARVEMRRPDPQVRYVTIEQVPYLVAIDAFVPEQVGSRSADGSALGFARRLDADRIREIGELYRLEGLKIAEQPGALPTIRKLSLASGGAEPVVTLTWRDQTPATNIRQSLRPWVLALGLVMTVLIFWVFYVEIRNHRERESLLHEMASIDHLTGISNRREFFVMADKVLSIARRADTPVSLLLLDVDNFKKVNDSLGHSRGDRILVLVAQQLREELREADVYARYGGDEFVIMLPGADADDALILAERLREKIADVSAEYARGKYDCTVSIGVVDYQQGESLEHLISRADDALYQAKYGGRNRAVKGSDRRFVFPDTTPSERRTV